ncbi:DUF1254 domain-containing protein [Variovorax humicola]|uniref:DUF1254 domain-containing protein n=1 Tax=Variovorax humicola TaxID=1769758 RepID=A0ABU8VTC7_9BURK
MEDCQIRWRWCLIQTLNLKPSIFNPMMKSFATVPADAAPLAASATDIWLSPEEAREIAVEAYVYAYPAVMLELTRRVSLGRPDAAPMNKFAHRSAFPDAGFDMVVRPNADTLYSILWFDVSSEPLVINVPDSSDRYYLLQMLDAWSDTFAVPGSRTTGNAAQRIVVAGPTWQGEVPHATTLVRSPTASGWIIGRTQTNGAADYRNVHRFQAGLTATPLRALGKPCAAPPSALDPSWDLATPPVEAIEKLDAQAYFELFVELMFLNPPHANDYPMLHRLARIGIEPGRPFSFATATLQVRQALEAAAGPALALVKNALATMGVRHNGWRTNLTAIGTYGADYRARAAIAFAGLGANPIEDAVYPRAFADEDGRTLSSDASYVLRFSKEQLPPVRAFWSLTMYDQRQLFAANAMNRYAIGDRDPLHFNADGSLEIHIQRKSPGKDKESNWLPAPASGPFTMNLRLYWPKAEALDGRWTPPPIRRCA